MNKPEITINHRLAARHLIGSSTSNLPDWIEHAHWIARFLAEAGDREIKRPGRTRPTPEVELRQQVVKTVFDDIALSRDDPGLLEADCRALLNWLLIGARPADNPPQAGSVGAQIGTADPIDTAFDRTTNYWQRFAIARRAEQRLSLLKDLRETAIAMDIDVDRYTLDAMIADQQAAYDAAIADKDRFAEREG